MDFDNDHNGMSMITDSSRPPQYSTRNIGSGCGQVFGSGGDDSDADSDMPRQRTDALLATIVHDHRQALRDDLSDDGHASPDGDEGLEDHQRDQHIYGADLGAVHVDEMRRLIAHHHHHYCNCPFCPRRRDAFVNEWRGAPFGPPSPDSVAPEHGSGEHSMASSWLPETRPPTPAAPLLLAEMGAQWSPEEGGGAYAEEYCYVFAPLRLPPERMMPHQLEESEPGSVDGF